MKGRFNRAELNEALTSICGVAATRTPKPVLQCVKLEAKPDVLILSATDLEVSLRYALTQVEIHTPGDVLVGADVLARQVRECPDDTVTLESDDRKLHLRSLDSHMQIFTQAVEEFPPVPGIDRDADFTIELGQLKRLIEWTAFAAARESTRYAINGILFELKGEKLTLAATDGRRLSCGHTMVKRSPKSQDAAVIVPVKPLQLLARTAIDPETPVAVKLNDNQALFHVGPAMLGTVLLEGQFPNYMDVIPVNNDKKVELSVAALQSGVKRSALLTNEESKGVRMSFSADGLRLSSRAPEQGEGEVTLSVDYRGEPTDIAFNPVFVLDLLRAIPDDTVLFSFKEPNRPGMFSVGKELLYVVMPVSLN